jgi:MFS family permease
VLTAGAVLGGIIGIILSDRLNWSAVQSFLITLGIALGCVVIFGVAYSLVFRRKQGE